MDLILYFVENPPDLTSVAILLAIYLLFEVLSEIIAEFFARPLFDKFRPDQRIKKIRIWLDTKRHKEIEGDDLKITNKKGYLTISDHRNPLYMARPDSWDRWERLE